MRSLTSLRPSRAVAFALLLVAAIPLCHASQLAEIKVLDRDYLMLHFLDSEIDYVDDGQGPTAFESFIGDPDNNAIVTFGSALNTSNATNTANWTLKSSSHSAYSGSGQKPDTVHRKRRPNGHSEEAWDTSIGDWTYDIAHEHYIYLKLPTALQQGASYTLEIAGNTNSNTTSVDFTYDIYSSQSEAIHVNLVGYSTADGIKSADLYHWMGDGSARDYSWAEGNKVYLHNVSNGNNTEVGSVQFWKANSNDIFYGRNMTGSDVWTVDFTGFTTPGTYRLVVEGVGCSPAFKIASDAYKDPFQVQTRGFYYMRIGQDSPNDTPVPRRPMWDPMISSGDDRATIKITTLDPYDSVWDGGGDRWDQPEFFANYLDGNKTNPNVAGGHSDALDWDRHLGHVSIIYDMLLPYFLTAGAIGDDNLDIAESGNGNPDILDEAQYEVDFWLSLRDGDGYSHGLSNPDSNHVLYQAQNTTIAAWANAANCAMLSECYRINGNTTLRNYYRDQAIIAYDYANSQSNKQLDDTVNVGEATMRGRDFKMTAAAYLYNVTGNTTYENAMAAESVVTGSSSQFMDPSGYNQLWGIAAYLHTDRTINKGTLWNNMKASVIARAKTMESDYAAVRPSRRATDETATYFQTIQNVHRSILAHSIADNPTDKATFLDAIILEADYGLGRNPMNLIQMTTAGSILQDKPSYTEIYTSGQDDGTPGLHPGHTPYVNHDDWWAGRVLGRPSHLYDECYPANFTSNWPLGEGYFKTRYIFAHTEFTPQQTMRGKMALYGYLYGLDSGSTPEPTPTGSISVTYPSSIPETGSFSFTVNVTGNGSRNLTASLSDGNDNAIANATWVAVNNSGTYTLTINNTSTLSTATAGLWVGLFSEDWATTIDDDFKSIAVDGDEPPPDPTDTQAPSTPANLASNSKSTSSVSLTWNASSDNVGVAGYDIYVNDSFNSTASSTSATVDGLSANTTYSFKVKAFDLAENESGFSNTISVTTDPSGGGGGLSITNVSLSSGKSAALDSSFAVGDDVYTDRTYTWASGDSVLDGEQWLRLPNNDKNRNDSSYLTFTVNESVTVYVLYDTRASSLPNWMSDYADTGISLDVNGDVGRKVYSNSYSAGTITLGANKASGAAGVGTGYSVVVVGSSPAPDPDPEPDPEPASVPSAPSSLSANASSSSQISLSWSDNSSNESGFKIEMRPSGGSFSQVDTVGAGVTSYTRSSLSADTTYDFRVRAYNNEGDSSYSNTSSATTSGNPGNGGFRYFRASVTETNNSGGQRLRIADFEISDGSQTASISSGLWDNLSVMPSSKTVDLGSGASMEPTSIIITTVYNTGRAPRDFTLEGSNDNSTWTVIYSESDRASSEYSGNTENTIAIP